MTCDDQKIAGANDNEYTIVLNAVDIPDCTFMCAEGFYHLDDGNEYTFTCSPKMDDRKDEHGNSNAEITCSSAC